MTQPRLDGALLADLRLVARSSVLRAFLVLELVAASILVLRRGDALLPTIAVVWVGLLCVGFAAWWAGRHRLAITVPDPVPAASGRARAALVGSLGLLAAGIGAWAIGVVLFIVALSGWFLLGGSGKGIGTAIGWRQLLRDPRPFVPLLLLVGVTRFLLAGVTPP